MKKKTTLFREAMVFVAIGALIALGFKGIDWMIPSKPYQVNIECNDKERVW